MSDYSAMTDAQINRLVAERLGYTVRKGDTYPNPWPPKGRVVRYWHVTIPGFEGEQTYSIAVDVDPWDWLFDESICKQWATDNNAAAALDFGGHTVQIDLYPNSATAKVLRKDGGIMIYEVAANMARAISIAWLAFMDAVEAGT